MDSFPSGHTLVTFCLAHVLSFYFPRYRLWFYLAALIVGFERMLCATHFPSDVVAGALLGIAIAAALLGYTPTRPLSSSSYL
jgi:undecaprenyl-diphosphatase